MASKTFTINGITYRRSKKQGRKNLPPELVKVPLTIYMIGKSKEEIKRKARGSGMSLSAYGEMAMILFDIGQFSALENCSKH